MRRRLLDSWPALSHEFGLHPWDVDRLTADEINAYVRWVNEKYRRR